MSASSSSPQIMDITPEELSCGMLVEEKSFLWKIQNFKEVCQSDQLIDAHKTEFQIGTKIGVPTSWSCYLSLQADPTSSVKNPPLDCIGIFIRLDKKPEDVKEVNVAFDIKARQRSFRENNRAYNAIVCAPFKNMANKGSWGTPEMCKRHNDESFTYWNLIEGSLWIEIQFKLYVPKPVTVSLAEKLKTFEPKSRAKLLEDLAKTDANANADTKIITMDKAEFAVNKAILSARSDVLQRMFQQVKIDDISGKTLAVLLQYITKGTLHNDWKSKDVLWELTYAADKYNLGLLKEFLDDALIDVCCKENAKQLAILAGKQGMKKAEKDLIDFVKRTATSAQDLVLESPPTKKFKPY